ncbi:MAG: hypothetical protein ING03_01370 [Roseomonas sp.]|jgi:hypothetical protein|nr:hypothetical protein [Roseomonas sp.]MCA3317706.1 hypothetical protein [Roseomonas sp.]MCA3320286.1 hypothetical protein [Roseomonas sp.]
MNIDLEQQATLNGIAPSDAAYVRGGTLAHGTVAEMVVRGLEYVEKGFVNVMVLYDGGMLDSSRIRELAAQLREGGSLKGR